MAARGEVELQGVIEEEDDDGRDFFGPAENQKKKTWDWDRVCAYKTFKIVRIRDRY